MGTGSTHSLLPDNDIQELLQQYSKRFYIISQTPNQTFILHQKLTHNKYLLRIIEIEQQHELSKFEQQILRKLACQSNQSELSIFHPNCEHQHNKYPNGNRRPQQNHIIPIADYTIKQQTTETAKICILFNIGEMLTLSDCLTLRSLKDRGEKYLFDRQQQILQGVYNLIEGLRLLRYYGQTHSHIHPHSVYMNQKGQLVLSDPWMITLATDTNQLSEDSHNISDGLQSQSEFFSPQKMKITVDGNGKIDDYASDLFSIGLIGLKARKLLRNKNKSVEQSSLAHQQFSFHQNNQIDFQYIHRLILNIQNNGFRLAIEKLLGTIKQRNQLFNNVLNYSRQPIASQVSPIKYTVRAQYQLLEPKQARKTFQTSKHPYLYSPPSANHQNNSFAFSYPNTTNFFHNSMEHRPYSLNYHINNSLVNQSHDKTQKVQKPNLGSPLSNQNVVNGFGPRDSRTHFNNLERSSIHNVDNLNSNLISSSPKHPLIESNDLLRNDQPDIDIGFVE